MTFCFLYAGLNSIIQLKFRCHLCNKAVSVSFLTCNVPLSATLPPVYTEKKDRKYKT